MLTSVGGDQGSAPGTLHVAIIMDGNGRWATARRLPRAAGHAAGARALQSLIPAVPRLGITHLTLYAFSADNWRRPLEETTQLMQLMERVLRRERVRSQRRGIAVRVVGRRDRLPAPLVRAIDTTEIATRHGLRLQLTIAIDYSSRASMRDRVLGVPALPALPDVDLLIRTSGEQRLSDFLLWEAAYAELLFLPTHWPDFTADHLSAALTDFQRRERRFGGLLRPNAAFA